MLNSDRAVKLWLIVIQLCSMFDIVLCQNTPHEHCVPKIGDPTIVPLMVGSLL